MVPDGRMGCQGRGRPEVRLAVPLPAGYNPLRMPLHLPHLVSFVLALSLAPALAHATPCNAKNTILQCKVRGDERAFNLASAAGVMAEMRLATPTAKQWWLKHNCVVSIAVPGRCDWVGTLAPGAQSTTPLYASPKPPPPKPTRVVAEVPKPKPKSAEIKPPEATVAAPTFEHKTCAWQPDDVDKSRLAALLKAHNFRPPSNFRAFVAVLDVQGDGIRQIKAFDWDGSADDPTGWNPASTVKIFSSVGAIEEVRARGFAKGGEVIFDYPHGKRTFSFGQLLWLAIWESDNIAHDRLMQIAGFDRLHGKNGVLARAGLTRSAVMRAYQTHEWEAEGHSRQFQNSPGFTLKAGKRAVKVPPRQGEATPGCRSAACTSLQELSRMMCHVMMHEQLPQKHRLDLGDGKDAALLKQLREALRTKRTKHPDGTWQAFADAFPGRKSAAGAPSNVYKKGGFADDWVSDNLFIRGNGNRRFLVAISAHGGRTALDHAARLIAEILRKDELVPGALAKKKEPKKK